MRWICKLVLVCNMMTLIPLLNTLTRRSLRTLIALPKMKMMINRGIAGSFKLIVLILSTLPRLFLMMVDFYRGLRFLVFLLIKYPLSALTSFHLHQKLDRDFILSQTPRFIFFIAILKHLGAGCLRRQNFRKYFSTDVSYPSQWESISRSEISMHELRFEMMDMDGARIDKLLITKKQVY